MNKAADVQGLQEESTQIVCMRRGVMGMKWSRLTSREMLRQSRNLLAFNALLLSIVLVRIKEPGFASEKLCVVIALSENKHTPKL